MMDGWLFYVSAILAGIALAVAFLALEEWSPRRGWRSRCPRCGRDR